MEFEYGDAEVGYPTDAAEWIFTEALPDWATEFLRKNADYGNTADLLGAKGQFADLWRKVGKLKRSLWDGEALTGEQPVEILEDLIGHCFLTLYFMDKEGTSKSHEKFDKLIFGDAGVAMPKVYDCSCCKKGDFVQSRKSVTSTCRDCDHSKGFHTFAEKASDDK